MIRIFFITLIFTASICSQQQLVITYGDFVNDEIRVGLLDINTASLTDVGFNKTYLPALLGNLILFNSDRFLWQTGPDGSGLTQLNKGFRASVSPFGDFVAYYSGAGIEICRSDFSLIKKIELDCNPDNQITWLPQNRGLTFFREGQTYAYDFLGDSIYKFGNDTYQPVWYGNSNRFIYTILADDSTYRVKLGNGLNCNTGDRELLPGSAHSFAPQWSNSGDYIAFYRLKPNIEIPTETDILPVELVVVNTNNPRLSAVFDDAGFTDGVFPQFTFSPDDNLIYYTSISKFGTGIIKAGNTRSGETKVIYEDQALDLRFPVFFIGQKSSGIKQNK